MRNLTRLCPNCSTPLQPHKQLCAACKKARQRVRCVEWNKKNPERIRAYARQRYHTESAEARAKRRSRSSAWNRKVRSWTSPTARFHSLKKSARLRNYCWEIPKELAYDLIMDNCFYCGTSPQPANGIDRVDNTKGYLEDNVVSCCPKCNVAKATQTKSEFESYLFRAAAHLKKHLTLQAA